ncbi:transposase [Streptomyces sp. NPDC005017]|uniref:transposase n=1 Tax=Streptomyces sp. NPDC005017 TaxID=3364706 RepID=UPI0036CCFDA2
MGEHRSDACTTEVPRRYPDEPRERAVREVQTSDRPVAHVARDLGVPKEALRGWVRQAGPTRAPVSIGASTTSPTRGRARGPLHRRAPDARRQPGRRGRGPQRLLQGRTDRAPRPLAGH